MTTMTRRAAMARLAATAAAATAFGSMASAQSRRIRHFWWGNPERDRRTFEVIDLFQAKHPDVAVSGETIGWNDYWTKMATQTAGGNMADLVQMDYRYLFEYARRGAIRPLDEFIGGGLDLSDFDKGPLEGGMVDGKLYALNIGSNSQVMTYNTRIFDETGVEFDPINWTYDDMIAAITTVNDKTGGAVKGTDDMSLNITMLEAWIQQNGRGFYDPEGNVTATPEDVATYWQFWADLRDAGLVVDAHKTVALGNSKMNEQGLVTGETAMSFNWSNQLVGVQSLMTDPIGAAMIPHKPDGAPGQFIKPSMFMSLSRDAGDTEAAIAYMNDWVNGPEATAILGLERGIPCSPKVRAALAPNLSPVESLSVSYFNAIQDKVGPLPPPAPKGAGEVSDAFMRTSESVVLGNIAPEDAAVQFIEDSQSIVERAL